MECLRACRAGRKVVAPWRGNAVHVTPASARSRCDSDIVRLVRSLGAFRHSLGVILVTAVASASLAAAGCGASVAAPLPSVWVVGSEGSVLVSRDGGSHWQRTVVGGGSELRDVTFADDKHGWTVGDGVVLATTNGGVSWSRESFPPGALLAVTGVDAEHAYAVGASGYPMVTTFPLLCSIP